MITAPLMNSVLATLVLAGHIGVAGIILLMIVAPRHAILRALASNAILLSFLVVSGAFVTSLVYSNVIGYAPCLLCWWQRIFLYPLVPMLGIALWRRDATVGRYAVPLAGIGFMIAIYHMFVERGGTDLLNCGAEGVSCSQRYVWEYGYISIPVMSFTAFLLVLVFFGLKRRHEAQKNF